MLSYFHRFSNLVWTGENDSNTPRVDAFIYLFFFWKKEKKISVFKYIWIHVAGA